VRHAEDARVVHSRVGRGTALAARRTAACATMLPREITTALERGHGVAARRDLLRTCTEGQVEGLVARRALVPVHRGVYRAAGAVLSPRGVAAAVLARVGPPARLTGPLVLALHAVPGADEHTAGADVLTTPGRRVRGIQATLRADRLDRVPTVEVDGLPCVPPAVALVHTASSRHRMTDRDLRSLLDRARWAGACTGEALEEAVEAVARAGGRDTGAARWRDVLGDLGVAPESDGERRLLALLARFDPPPAPQVWVTPRRRVDAWFAGLRAAFEYDGHLDHTGARRRSADAARDAELHAAGAVVWHVTAADLDDERAFLAHAAGLLAARAAGVGVPAPTLRR
jgi:hypothetical protein